MLIDVFLCHLQIVSLSTGEQEWLSNHLGHEIKIDKDYYRNHEAVVEIAKPEPIQKATRWLNVWDLGHLRVVLFYRIHLDTSTDAKTIPYFLTGHSQAIAF